MTAHTPGPWQVDCDPWHYDTASVVTAGPREMRGGVGQRLIVQVGGWADVPEQEANTRLIAACPDLLNALRKVAQTLEWHAHGRLRGIDEGPLLSSSAAVELAESVIAKAIGTPGNVRHGQY
jgi:hypothetical protein